MANPIWTFKLWIERKMFMATPRPTWARKRATKAGLEPFAQGNRDIKRPLCIVFDLRLNDAASAFAVKRMLEQTMPEASVTLGETDTREVIFAIDMLPKAEAIASIEANLRHITKMMGGSGGTWNESVTRRTEKGTTT